MTIDGPETQGLIDALTGLRAKLAGLDALFQRVAKQGRAAGGIAPGSPMMPIVKRIQIEAAALASASAKLRQSAQQIVNLEVKGK